MASDAPPGARRTSAAVREAQLDRPAPRLLTVVARVTLLFPLLFLSSLYGEWLLASFVLGHPPRPSIDDPKDVPLASIAHWGVMIGFVAMLPICLAALFLNTWDASARKLGEGVAAARAVLILGLLVGTFAWLWWDPGRVAYWWMD